MTVNSSVSSGQVLSGQSFGPGSDLFVMSGGTAVDIVLAGGYEDVMSGGTDSGATIGSGGEQDVVFGGSAFAGVIDAGGVQDVVGGTVSATVVMAGGELYDAGLSLDTVVSGGHISIGDIPARGTAIGTQLLSGGVADLSFFGVASSTFVGSGCEQVVGPGGYDFGGIIGAGGVEQVAGAMGFDGYGAFFGTATGTQVLSGGELIIGAAADDVFGASPPMVSDVMLAAGGTIDLFHVGFAPGLVADFDAADDVLTIEEGGTVVALQQLAGDYAGEVFSLSADPVQGTDVTVGVPCYCRGTRILTDTGEVAVEALAVGAGLVTASGAVRVLRWIGRRSYGGRFAAANPDVMPVRLRAGCLGGGLPRRDLDVSPLHAVLLDGVLVPAGCLVDGDRIVRLRDVARVEYFHLELDSHDVILAEGAAAETYVDDGNRGMFHNGAEARDFVAARGYCAPRIEHGPQLQAIRRRLGNATAAPLRGWLDLATHERIAGWAEDDDGAVRLRLIADGVTLAVITANGPRPDVAPGAWCGFDHAIAHGLDPGAPHVIEVRRCRDDVALPNGPWLLACRAMA